MTNISGMNDDEKVQTTIKALRENYNVSFTSKKLGSIEFRQFSLKEFSHVNEFLKEPIGEREFAIKLIYGLIVEPTLSIDDFNKIPNLELISIIRQICDKNETLRKFFKKPEDLRVFIEFKETVKKYNDKKYAEFLEAINSSGIEYSTKTIDNFQKLVIPQISIYNSWFQSNQSIFNKISRSITDSQQILIRYRTTIKNLNKILSNYYWFYSFSLPGECYGEIIEVYNSGENVEMQINEIFTNHFSQENFDALDTMVRKWNDNPIFLSRMEIINDCIRTLKNIEPGYNPPNVILPVLIAQIDGILKDFVKKHGFIFYKSRRMWQSPSGEICNFENAYLSIELDDDWISEYSNYLLLNVLFQTALHGDELTVLPTFSRHKILHGESIDYGKMENVIRAFLILDFLSDLA